MQSYKACESVLSFQASLSVSFFLLSQYCSPQGPQWPLAFLLSPAFPVLIYNWGHGIFMKWASFMVGCFMSQALNICAFNLTETKDYLLICLSLLITFIWKKTKTKQNSVKPQPRKVSIITLSWAEQKKKKFIIRTDFQTTNHLRITWSLCKNEDPWATFHTQ